MDGHPGNRLDCRFKEQLKTAEEHKHSCKERLEEVTAYGTTLKKQLKDAVGLQKQDEHLVEDPQIRA